MRLRLFRQRMASTVWVDKADKADKAGTQDKADTRREPLRESLSKTKRKKRGRCRGCIGQFGLQKVTEPEGLPPPSGLSRNFLQLDLQNLQNIESETRLPPGEGQDKAGSQDEADTRQEPLRESLSKTKRKKRGRCRGYIGQFGLQKVIEPEGLPPPSGLSHNFLQLDLRNLQNIESETRLPPGEGQDNTPVDGAPQ